MAACHLTARERRNSCDSICFAIWFRPGSSKKKDNKQKDSGFQRCIQRRFWTKQQEQSKFHLHFIGATSLPCNHQHIIQLPPDSSTISHHHLPMDSSSSLTSCHHCIAITTTSTAGYHLRQTHAIPTIQSPYHTATIQIHLRPCHHHTTTISPSF